MTEKLENQNAVKPEAVTGSDAATGKGIHLVVEKTAEKSTKVEEFYDKNNPIFSK